MKIFLSIAAFAASATLISSAALAQATANGDMAVSASVSRTCTVSAATLAFGAMTGAVANTSSAVSVACTAGSGGAAPTITLSNGLNAVAPALRNLIGGNSSTALIPYTLSATPGGANLAPVDTVATTGAGGGTSYSTTVYGSIAASTNYQIGSFNDTVTITVSYAP